MSLLVLRTIPLIVVQKCEPVQLLGADPGTASQVLLPVRTLLLSLTCRELAGCLLPLTGYEGIDALYLEWSRAHQMQMKGCSLSASLRHFTTTRVGLPPESSRPRNKNPKNLGSWLLNTVVTV